MSRPDRDVPLAEGEHLSGAGGVPVGPCPRCEREVVAYLRDPVPEAFRHGAAAGGSPGGDEAYACVHCDGAVRGIAWRDETELDDLGYVVKDPLAAGCGTGCGTGGCAPKPRTIDEMLARAKLSS